MASAEADRRAVAELKRAAGTQDLGVAAREAVLPLLNQVSALGALRLPMNLALVANDVGLLVLWLWIASIARAIGSGAAVIPIRHPVIANVFDRQLHVIVRSFHVAQSSAAHDANFCPPYSSFS